MEQSFVVEKILIYLGSKFAGPLAAATKEWGERVKMFKTLNPPACPVVYYASSESSEEGSSSCSDSFRQYSDESEEVT